MRHERLFAAVARNVQLFKHGGLGRLGNRPAGKVRWLGILGPLELSNTPLVVVVLVGEQLAAVHATDGNNHLLALPLMNVPERLYAVPQFLRGAR